MDSENEYWFYIDTDEKYVETLSAKLIVIPATGDSLFTIGDTKWIIMSTKHLRVVYFQNQYVMHGENVNECKIKFHNLVGKCKF